MVYLTLLILHFIGLVLGVGTSFAMLRLGVVAKGLEPAERSQFMLRVAALSKNGSIGLALLILTGVGMLLLRGPAEIFRWGGPAFHVKLTLVVITAGLFGYMQSILKKVRDAGGGPLMAKLPKVGAALLGLGVATIIAAVVAFK